MARKRKEADQGDLEIDPVLEAPRGRVRSAWDVLRGQRVTPIQIQAEWVEYKAIFSDLLARHSMMLARHAKAEKERLDRTFKTLEGPEEQPDLPGLGDPRKSHKDQLRTQFANVFLGTRKRPQISQNISTG